MIFSNKFIKASDELCDFDRHVPAPYFRKKFVLDFCPKKAEITICGLGFYELYINGTNITKGPLAPYISNTDHILYYDSYDLSRLLHEGENVVGVLLGNGFRNPFGGFIWDFQNAPHRGVPTVALCLEAENESKRFLMEADESFKTHASPILFDDLRMGIRYDANREIPGWNCAAFDDADWKNALPEKTPRGEPKLCTVEPIAVTEALSPVKITHFDILPFAYKNPPDSGPYESAIGHDVYLYDFGVNTAGVTKLKIKNAKRGQKITVRHAEYYNNGIFSVNTTIFNRPHEPGCVEKYIEYGQTDVYICKGGDEEFLPIFKYDGFRYACVEGLTKEQATSDAVTCLVMHSDIKEKAHFSSSDDDLNRLWEMIVRSDFSNFYYFPTDCPHREKNGWTGDASVSAERMLLHLTAENSLKEWLAGIRMAQLPDGMLPGIVPTATHGFGYEWGNGPAWDNVCVNLPYYIYRFTGDTAVIRENLPMIARYLAYIADKRDEKGLIHIGLGDWVEPFRVGDVFTAPLALTDSVTVFEMARKAAFLFRQIGEHDEADKAENLEKEIREAVRTHLIDFDTMKVMGDCQTAQVFPIAAGIFNSDEIPTATKRLLEIIHRDGDINTCGMIGLRHMYHVLTAAGESDLAYRIITSRKRGCYGYWLANGATSMWESFTDPKNGFGDSQNHHFLGDIGSWFIQDIAGLCPNPTVSDLTEAKFAPHFLRALNYAKADYRSPFGTLFTEWQRNGKEIQLRIFIPTGMYAKVVLSDGYRFADGTTEKKIIAGKENTFNCCL